MLKDWEIAHIAIVVLQLDFREIGHTSIRQTEIPWRLPARDDLSHFGSDIVQIYLLVTLSSLAETPLESASCVRQGFAGEMKNGRRRYK
ncbi:hypothetical protein ACFL6S_14700 [Candidatus Poribacteria bacterium]